jgi:hypothetical protein
MLAGSGLAEGMSETASWAAATGAGAAAVVQVVIVAHCPGADGSWQSPLPAGAPPRSKAPRALGIGFATAADVIAPIACA